MGKQRPKQRLWSRRSGIKAFLLATVVLFMTVGVLTACSGQDEKAKTEKSKKPVASATSSLTEKAKEMTPSDWRTAIERVAEKAIPSVVHVEVTEYREVNNPMLPFQNDPFFQQFFGFPRGPRKFKQELKGLGSGIIMDSQGHILTNNHVAGNASKIEVLLANGKRYPAKLVGADPKTDLAVIKISAKGPLPYATFGDSDKVKVGQWVVAIGQPLGLSQTVTQGIISAEHRTGIMNPSSYEDYLQTDAAINPGNSGGPLLTLEGKVIGINSAIMTKSGGFEGVGFAIPSNMAVYIAKQLIAHGTVTRGWLGVTIQTLTPDLAKSFGVETTNGVLVADVVKGGPADKAGMKTGDIVISYNGKAIRDTGGLRNDVAITPVGKEVTVTVLRSGKKVDLTVKIGNLKDAAKFLSGSVTELLGAKVHNVTSKEAKKYGLNPRQGVVLTWVDPKGPLGEAGFEVGDIILQINGQAITGVESLDALVSTLGPHQRLTVLALDHRTGRTGYIQVVSR